MKDQAYLVNLTAMKKSYYVYIAIALIGLALTAIIAALYLNKSVKPQAPTAQQAPSAPAPRQYSKGNVSFSYPANWKTNDIPASPGLISVQVYDPDDFIVFVASSGTTLNDYKVNGELQYEKDAMIGGISGRERLWEDDKSKTAIFRADDFEFQKRFYRFEMFTSRSREVKAQKIWEDILASVKFTESKDDAIQATPK